jgi:prepilin-type N-terminal cleavage/methylation domain-containing protein
MYDTHNRCNILTTCTLSAILPKARLPWVYKKTMSGFTLIEFVIVMIIISIIAATSSRLILEGSEAYYNAQNILVGYWQGEMAMQRFARDVGTIRSKNDISTATSTNLVFTDINGNSVNYALSGTSITINGNTLADGIDVTNSSFAYFDNTLTTTSTLTSIRYIKIQLKITKNNTSYTTINTLYPRNLQ